MVALVVEVATTELLIHTPQLVTSFLGEPSQTAVAVVTAVADGGSNRYLQQEYLLVEESSCNIF